MPDSSMAGPHAHFLYSIGILPSRCGPRNVRRLQGAAASPYKNNSTGTRRSSASCLACVLLIPRLPLRIPDRPSSSGWSKECCWLPPLVRTEEQIEAATARECTGSKSTLCSSQVRRPAAQIHQPCRPAVGEMLMAVNRNNSACKQIQEPRHRNTPATSVLAKSSPT